jgi:hypothetical protein
MTGLNDESGTDRLPPRVHPSTTPGVLEAAPPDIPSAAGESPARSADPPPAAAGASLGSRTVTALFADRTAAEQAYDTVIRRGYAANDVSLVMSDDARKRHFAADSATTELGNKAAQGAGVGGAIGGALGAIVAAVAAIGTTLVLPGIGLVVAGPLAAGLAGAGAGGAAGTLVGALVGWGIPEERVRHYESGIRQGGILIGVRAHSDEDAAYFEREWTTLRGDHVVR